MTPLDELIFLETADLIIEVEEAADLANQELAHEIGDNILVIAILRAAQGEITPGEAQALVEAYQDLNRQFG